MLVWVGFGSVSAEFIHQRLPQRFLRSWLSTRSNCLLVRPNAEQLSCGFLKRQPGVVGRVVAGAWAAWIPALVYPNKLCDFRRGTLFISSPVNQTTRWPSRSFPQVLPALLPVPAGEQGAGTWEGQWQTLFASLLWTCRVTNSKEHFGCLAPQSFRTQEASGTIQSSLYYEGFV